MSITQRASDWAGSLTITVDGTPGAQARWSRYNKDENPVSWPICSTRTALIADHSGALSAGHSTLLSQCVVTSSMPRGTRSPARLTIELPRNIFDDEQLR